MVRISPPRLVAALLLTIALGMSTTVLAERQGGQPAPAIVDINTASVEQIEMIVTDAALARRIVESRPFANKRQLVTRELMPLEDYDRIKDRIVARRVVSEPQND